MSEPLHIRVVSAPHWLYKRAYRLEVKRRHFSLWKLGYVTTWEPIGKYMPAFETEEKAKVWAEEYAKGTWVSDSAVFDAAKP
jgi:hypothetical protein